MLFAGFALFLVDLSLDIKVAAEYKDKFGHVWFRWALFFILVRLFLVSFMAAVEATDNCNAVSCCCIFSYFSIILRFAQEVMQWKRTYWDRPPCGGGNYEECPCERCTRHRGEMHDFKKSTYEFAWIRYVEAITGSAPQWCLQVYMIFRQRSLPRYILPSVVFSVLSLAWSITNLEKRRVVKEGHNFKLPATVVFFTFQLFTLLPRLFAIVIFAYVFETFVFVLLLLHWLAITLVILRTESVRQFRDTFCAAGYRGHVKAFLLSFLICFPFLFHPSRAILILTGTYSRAFYNKVYGALSVQNFICTLLAIFVIRPNVEHLSVGGPIAVSIVTLGVVIGAVLSVEHYYQNQGEGQQA
jgi:hypothetical protein